MRVLGVHIRGTDMGHLYQPLTTFFGAIDNFLAHFEPRERVVVLLATDDQQYFNATVARYGRRVATQNGGEIQRAVGHANMYEAVSSDALRVGEEVITDTLLLSRSDFLLRLDSAVSEWAIFYNPRLIANSWTFGASNGEAPSWMNATVAGACVTSPEICALDP